MSKLIDSIEKLKSLLQNVVNGVSEVSQTVEVQEEENTILFEDHTNRLSSLETNSQSIWSAHNSLSSRVDKIGDKVTEIVDQLKVLDGHVDNLYLETSNLNNRLTSLERGEEIPTDPIPEPTKPKLIIPEGSIIVPLQSTEIANISRSSSLVSTGIPLAENLNVTDISRLVLISKGIDNEVIPLPADFRPTSWWRTAKSPDGIMFVQVSFFDSFSEGQKRNYQLVILPPAKNPGPIALDIDKNWIFNPSSSLGYLDAIHDKQSSTIMVDTGVARFTIGTNGVFDSIETIGSDSQLLLSSSETSITFDNKTDTLSKLRRMEIEYLGPLVCYILVETETSFLSLGTFQTDAKKSARFSTVRRYQFVRGSGICTIQNVLSWEGTKNGSNHLMPDGVNLNSVLGTSWKDTIQTNYSTGGVSLLFDGPESEIQILDLPHKKVTLSEVQHLRANRKSPRLATIDYEFDSMKDTESRGIIRAGNIIVGLQNMSQHEPQALRFNTENGILSLEYASDKFHLAFNQGVCITSIIGIAKESDSLASIWADMNHPMRVFAVDPDYYNVSAFGPVPTTEVDNINQPISLGNAYASALSAICNKTLQLTSRDGLYGLMTSHTAPRSWDDSWMETSDKNLSWDTLFATSAFTDYYSTFRSSAMLSLMTGNSSWLDSLSFPAAQRMLHTQIIQCAPEDPWSKAGWGFTGYAAYRSDGNSSHSYYENLFWYYLLTGDKLVIDIITRGERILANELKTQNVSGRFPNQHFRAQRFLSHCHYDMNTGAFFQVQWKAFTRRAIDECYVEGTYNGKPIALWVDSAWNETKKKFESSKKKPGLLRTPNLYAFSIWDLETLWQVIKYHIDMEDHISDVGLELIRKYILLVSTIQTYGSSIVNGDGSLSRSSLWARAFKFNWDGNPDPTKSIISNLAAGEEVDGNTLLYPDDIHGMCGSWSRAASLTKDPIMIENSRKIVNYSLNRILTAGQPMNKLSGLMDSTLVAAVYEEENR